MTTGGKTERAREDDEGRYDRCRTGPRDTPRYPRDGNPVPPREWLVEVPGIEPGSYGIPSRLLRAQFAMPLLGSPDHANKSG